MYKGGKRSTCITPRHPFRRDASRKRAGISYTWCLLTCVYHDETSGSKEEAGRQARRERTRGSKFNDCHPTSALFRLRVFFLVGERMLLARGSPRGFLRWSKLREQTLSTCERATNLGRKKRSFYDSLFARFIFRDTKLYSFSFAPCIKRRPFTRRNFAGLINSEIYVSLARVK